MTESNPFTTSPKPAPSPAEAAPPQGPPHPPASAPSSAGLDSSAESPLKGEGPAAATPPAGRRRSKRRIGLEAGLLLLIAVALPASRGGWYTASSLDSLAPPAGKLDEHKAAESRRRIASYQPRGTWVVVDTYGNRLRVFRNHELLREAIVSTGSGTVLRDPVSDRTWVFDTPQGERQVQRKVQDPVWIKPDWAFIEEGFEPPTRWRDRIDSMSLGDYGIYLGDGYIIHGTLFQTLLGQRVTHGCIRVGDEDLKWLYWQLPMGSRVYLY
jgi:lipoprotein-anchoring transpeptidase ErfK/SrfK